MTSTAARVPTAVRNCLQLASNTANFQKSYRGPTAGLHLRDARRERVQQRSVVRLHGAIFAPVRMRRAEDSTRRGFGPQPDHLYALHGGSRRCSISAAGFCGGVWANFYCPP